MDCLIGRLPLAQHNSSKPMLRIKYPSKNNVTEFDTAEVCIPTTSHSHTDVSVLPIGKVRQFVEQQLNVNLSSQELIYAGRKLNKLDKLLSDYGVKPNSIPVMHLLPKPKSRVCGDVMTAPNDKLESVQSQEQLQRFTSEFPTLHEALQDPAVVTQLRGFAANLSIHDFDLMLTLLPAGAPQIDPAQFRERLLMADTLPEYLKSRPELAGFLDSLLIRDSSGRFRIDQKKLGEIPELYNMGEDEPEMDMDMNPGSSLFIDPPISAVIQPTPVLPAVPQLPAQPQQPQQQQPQQQQQPLISEEMLSLALAQTVQGTAPRQPMRPAPGNMREKLRTLREMGFSNETACLRALQASNGDVEAAVNLMFTSDLF